MVRNDFAEKQPEEHERMIAALIEACRFCDQPANRETIIEMLARLEYVNAAPEALRRSFGGSDDFMIFARDNANEPSLRKAAWILENLRDSGLCRDSSLLSFALAKRVFRSDLYERALRLCKSTQTRNEHETQIVGV
jgi:NitT/TauT family transport system ATP-binding protein